MRKRVARKVYKNLHAHLTEREPKTRRGRYDCPYWRREDRKIRRNKLRFPGDPHFQNQHPIPRGHWFRQELYRTTTRDLAMEGCLRAALRDDPSLCVAGLVPWYRVGNRMVARLHGGVRAVVYWGPISFVLYVSKEGAGITGRDYASTLRDGLERAAYNALRLASGMFDELPPGLPGPDGGRP